MFLLTKLISNRFDFLEEFENESNEFMGHSIFYLQNQKNVMLRPIRKTSDNVDFYQPTERKY